MTRRASDRPWRSSETLCYSAGMMEAAARGERAKRLANAGLYLDAEAELRVGLTEHPGHPVLSYALAILLLGRGAFAEGWKLYESRTAMPGGPRPPNFSFPRWDGESVRTLLVLPEQGFGDQIMFARFVRDLPAMGIAATLVTPAATARLFADLGANIIIADGSVTIPRHDAWCYIGSLPGILGSLPTNPYLTASGTPQGIGVMLRGSGKFPHRELPSDLVRNLEQLGTNLHPDETGARDFRETADIIANLELVISIDTSVAHLSAALGKETWVLLPHSPDWRWGRTGQRSNWYPSMRLFRQETKGDWVGPVEAIHAALARASN